MEIEVALTRLGNKETLKKIKQFTDTHFHEELDHEHSRFS